jgi:hypothetical protein
MFHPQSYCTPVMVLVMSMSIEVLLDGCHISRHKPTDRPGLIGTEQHFIGPEASRYPHITTMA